MAWLALNGMNVGAIASVGDAPKGDRRDIGEMGPAGDGSMRVTRQTRKRDLKFSTVPLTGALALAWESLIVGEGETWSFDTSEYGSKGGGPAAGGVYTLGGAAAKYGAGGLRLPATTGLIRYPATLYNLAAVIQGWTVMVWRQETPFQHYIVRSDGAKWLNGISNPISTSSWLTVNTGGVPDGVQLANTSGLAVDYDELVILPYVIPDAWAPLMYAAHAAPWSALPFLNATGLVVTEQTTRRVLGTCSESILVATPKGGVRQPDMRRLEVDLKAA